MSPRQHKGIRASGQCQAVPYSELIIATDASVKENAHCGAYIATTGRWGLVAARYGDDICYPNCAEATELRAVWYGIKANPLNEVVTFRIDSQNAVERLTRWQEGDTTQPLWYDTRRRSHNHREGKPTLISLQERVTANAASLHFEHVKGHNGNPLNEAADGLAGIGANYLAGRYNTTNEARQRGAELAASFLISYAQTQTP